MNCATPLGTAMRAADGAVSNTQAKNQPLDKFIPRELMMKFEAARAQDAMVGERRVITMLFCDVKGSTAAAEKVDPETWTDIMNGIFEFMIRPVYKYEGTVPRLMGDAILAFFGAPIAHEDDPQRAVLAGLEIQEGIKEYAEEIRIKHGIEFGLRVGINTGLVVVGAIGSDLRMEYTAIGDAINLAARMEQTAAPGTVQISDETHKLVAPFFDFEALGEVEVKGKSMPVKTYRPLGPKKSPGHLRGLDGLTSPLVGREEQLGLLNRQVQQLRVGAGSIVTVIGEAGLGKSTLIAELKKSNDGFTWLRGDAVSYARSVSYFTWRQIIRQSIEAHDDDSPSEVRHKLTYVCDCCTLPGGDIPFLEAMLAVESEESLQVVTGFQGEALVQRMVEAVRGYLCGLAKEGALAIVFDDLHWADEASLNLLLSLADLTDTQPILFICMLRPDKTAASWEAINKIQQKATSRYHSVLLEPLHEEQTDRLLSNLLGVKDLPKNVRDMIIERANGNPFFIEELIRSLIETKQIIRENNHWQAVHEDAKVSLPDTLRGVLGARIDRLPEQSKHVLQNAAVIGRSFDLRVLKQLTSLNGSFDSQIQYLQEASLVEPFREEYAFRHVLIQEAAYDSILIKKRVELHKRIAATLAELHANRIEEFAPLIAYHYYAAQDERSLKYDLLAGEKAARLYANAEAGTHFSRALEVAKRVNAEIGILASIFSQLGSVYELSGQYDRALETYKDMQSASIKNEDRSMELKSLMAFATIYSTLTPLHNSELGEMNLKQALILADELGDVSTQAKLRWNLMLNFLFSDRLREALEHCEPAITLARRVGDLEQLAFTLNDAGRVYQSVGAYEKAFEAFNEANELWKQQGNQVMLADNLGASSITNYFAGNYDKALLLADKAWEISKETDNYWGQSYSRVIPTYICLDRGLPDLVVRYATECIEAGKKGGLIASVVVIPVELAWLYGLYGETGRGIDLAEQALETAIEKMPDWKSLALGVMIRLHLLMGNIDAAEKIINTETLNPILSVVHSHYLAMITLATIELELARNNFQKALSLIDQLLEEISLFGWIHNPEVMNRKADALIGLGRLDEALQTLTEARSLAEKLDAKHHLWSILSNLANVSSQLGKPNEADMYRKQAREIIEFIADRLAKIDLKDSFLNQPRVKKLMP